MAHVRRWDHLTLLVLHTACALYWAHPAIWYIAGRVRVEAEKACDDRVLKEGTSGPAYAEQLLSLARDLQPAPASPANAMAMTRSSLPVRITSILNPTTRRVPMNRLRLTVALLAAIAIMLPVAGLESRQTEPTEPSTSLDDPGFLEIAETGARDSDELRQLVTTYAANSFRQEAVDAFAAYLQRDDRSEDPYCTYCTTLLATAEREDQDRLVALFYDAVDIVLERSAQLNTGDHLVGVALTTALSRNPANWNRAFYYMSAAAQFGISDPMKVRVVQFLAEVGRHADALELAATVYDDRGSTHYRSPELAAWIAWLNREIQRHDQMTSFILAPLRD